MVNKNKQKTDYIDYGIERIINDLKLETVINSVQVEKTEKEKDKKC